MESQEQDKPKLTYEQVQQIIQERINLMDEKTAETTVEAQDVDQRGTLWQRIKRYFRGKSKNRAQAKNRSETK